MPTIDEAATTLRAALHDAIWCPRGTREEILAKASAACDAFNAAVPAKLGARKAVIASVATALDAVRDAVGAPDPSGWNEQWSTVIAEIDKVRAAGR